MRLTHFSSSEKSWKIAEMLPLQAVNLLVGKNAVGKSKTIRSLGDVIAFLLQQKDASLHEKFSAFLGFEDNGESIIYTFVCSRGEVILEYLAVNGEKFLQRDEKSATLHQEAINPPSNKLILHVRRDTVQYPYIEKVMSWAEQACGLSFNEMDVAGDNSTASYILGQQQDLYTLFKSLSQDAINHIISEAQSLGFPITKIKNFTIGTTLKKVIFKEEGVENILIDRFLSKGMFRTLYLLIYIEYLSHHASPSLLLIDDLCEGLDYERSTQLGKLLFDFCLGHNIQLIASSNDTFLMDVVDLKYWNILQREGSQITSINIQDNPDLFEDFRFTGLSNFDFMSSDYIQRHLSKTLKNE